MPGLIDRDDFVAVMRLLELIRPKLLDGLPTVNRSFVRHKNRVLREPSARTEACDLPGLDLAILKFAAEGTACLSRFQQIPSHERIGRTPRRRNIGDLCPVSSLNPRHRLEAYAMLELDCSPECRAICRNVF
jgi:hypothetical protein